MQLLECRIESQRGIKTVGGCGVLRAHVLTKDMRVYGTPILWERKMCTCGVPLICAQGTLWGAFCVGGACVGGGVHTGHGSTVSLYTMCHGQRCGVCVGWEKRCENALGWLTQTWATATDRTENFAIDRVRLQHSRPATDTAHGTHKAKETSCTRKVT